MLEEIIDRIMEKHVYVKQKRSGLVSDDSIVTVSHELQRKIAEEIKYQIENMERYHGNTAILYARAIEENFNGFLGCMRRINQIVKAVEKDEMPRLIQILKVNRGVGEGIVEATFASYTEPVSKKRRKPIFDCLEYYADKKVADLFGNAMSESMSRMKYNNSILNKMNNHEIKTTIAKYQNKISLKRMTESLLNVCVADKESNCYKNSLDDIAKFFRKKNVMEIMEQKIDARPLCRVITDFANKRLIDKTVKLYRMNPNYDSLSIVEDIANANNVDLCNAMIDVLMQYNDIPEVAKTIKENIRNISPNTCKALLHETAYKAIEKSDNKKTTCYRIFSKNYGLFLTEIKDKEVNEKISLKELEIIETAYVLILEIHRDREQYEEKILSGFFKELNRAISQGDNYDSKIRELNQYCKEVKMKLFENVDELMYSA